MPKAFSEHEKETIRQQMRKKARQLFEKHGLRKTSVDELSEAAGISKGAFYLFYTSKEELYLEILEEHEADFRSCIFDVSIRSGENAQEQLSTLLKSALLTWDRYPLLKNFSMADYDYLTRKLPSERVQGHVNRDNEFVNDFIKRVTREGIRIKAPPHIISNLMKSLFFVSLHRDDLGENGYNETMGVLTDLVARYMLEGTK